MFMHAHMPVHTAENLEKNLHLSRGKTSCPLLVNNVFTIVLPICCRRLPKTLEMGKISN